MTTLRPSAPRPTYRHPWRTAVVLLVGLGLCAAAGWIGWNLFGDGDKKGANASPSTSVSTSLSQSSCAPVKTRDPGVKIPAKMPEPAEVKVNVYNATERAGLAARTADSLADRGFVIGFVSNDPKNVKVKGGGEVRYGQKGRGGALLIWAQVPNSKLVKDDRTTTDVDVAIGNGFDNLATPEQAVAALDPTKVSASPVC
jgi:hypothetical protein